METRNVACKSIEWLKLTGEKNRTFDKDFAGMLAKSIDREGLFNAIVLRPHPEKLNHYIGIQGKHRWYAVAKVLKHDLIEAKILTGMDDNDAAMATVTENLWRNELSKSQRLKQLKVWAAYYAAKNPEVSAPGSAGGTARAAQQESAKSPAGEESGSTPTPTGFNDMVAAATGKSASSVKRDLRLAKMFDDDQLEAFEQMKVTKDDMLAVSKIKDANQRNEVCSLIASGLDPKESITQVTGDVAPAGASGKPKAELQAAAKAEQQAELGDDEWFTLHCGDKAAMLVNPTRYKVDALLFRAISTPRHTFRAKSKDAIATAKDSKSGGPYLSIIRRSLNIAHPKDWFVCEKCIGKGVVGPEPTKCPTCYGGGYLLKTEELA